MSLDIQVCGPSAYGGRDQRRTLALLSRSLSAFKFSSDTFTVQYTVHSYDVYAL